MPGTAWSRPGSSVVVPGRAAGGRAGAGGHRERVGLADLVQVGSVTVRVTDSAWPWRWSCPSPDSHHADRLRDCYFGFEPVELIDFLGQCAATLRNAKLEARHDPTPPRWRPRCRRRTLARPARACAWRSAQAHRPDECCWTGRETECTTITNVDDRSKANKSIPCAVLHAIGHPGGGFAKG